VQTAEKTLNKDFDLVVIRDMNCYFFSMKNWSVTKSLMVGVASLICAGSALADAAAEKVLAKARFATALQNQDLSGQLRKGGKRYPITLFLRQKNIQFHYLVGKEWVKFHMRQNKEQFDLFEMRGGKTFKFDDKKLVQPIQGTDLTFEDLSMKFLYWKNAKIVKEERIKGQKCDVVRLINPGKSGRYAIVYAWIHKEQAALMKVVGYDAKGRVLKQFSIDKIMKVGKTYTLEKMRIDTFDPERGRSIGVTYMEFRKPKKKANDDDDL